MPASINAFRRRSFGSSQGGSSGRSLASRSEGEEDHEEYVHAMVLGDDEGSGAQDGGPSGVRYLLMTCPQNLFGESKQTRIHPYNPTSLQACDLLAALISSFTQLSHHHSACP